MNDTTKQALALVREFHVNEVLEDRMEYGLEDLLQSYPSVSGSAILQVYRWLQDTPPWLDRWLIQSNTVVPKYDKMQEALWDAFDEGREVIQGADLVDVIIEAYFSSDHSVGGKSTIVRYRSCLVEDVNQGTWNVEETSETVETWDNDKAYFKVAIPYDTAEKVNNLAARYGSSKQKTITAEQMIAMLVDTSILDWLEEFRNGIDEQNTDDHTMTITLPHLLADKVDDVLGVLVSQYSTGSVAADRELLVIDMIDDVVDIWLEKARKGEI